MDGRGVQILGYCRGTLHQGERHHWDQLDVIQSVVSSPSRTDENWTMSSHARSVLKRVVSSIGGLQLYLRRVVDCTCLLHKVCGRNNVWICKIPLVVEWPRAKISGKPSTWEDAGAQEKKNGGAHGTLR